MPGGNSGKKKRAGGKAVVIVAMGGWFSSGKEKGSQRTCRGISLRPGIKALP